MNKQHAAAMERAWKQQRQKRRDGQQIFYAESGAGDYSTDTHLCGALAGKGSAKSQKESVLKNKGWFAILDWMKK